VVCTIPARRGLADAMDCAALLIEGQEAAAALVILADRGGLAAVARCRPTTAARDAHRARMVGPSSRPARAVRLTER